MSKAWCVMLEWLFFLQNGRLVVCLQNPLITCHLFLLSLFLSISFSIFLPLCIYRRFVLVFFCSLYWSLSNYHSFSYDMYVYCVAFFNITFCIKFALYLFHLLIIYLIFFFSFLVLLPLRGEAKGKIQKIRS